MGGKRLGNGFQLITLTPPSPSIYTDVEQAGRGLQDSQKVIEYEVSLVYQWFREKQCVSYHSGAA